MSEQPFIDYDAPFPTPVTRRDKVVYRVWEICAIAAILLLIPSFFLPWAVAKGFLSVIVPWLLLLPYLLFDLCIPFLSIMDMQRRGRPFAFPLLSWVYYLVFTRAVFGGSKRFPLVLLILTLFYLLCQHFIAWIWAKLKGKPEANQWLFRTLVPYGILLSCPFRGAGEGGRDL